MRTFCRVVGFPFRPVLCLVGGVFVLVVGMIQPNEIEGAAADALDFLMGRQ